LSARELEVLQLVAAGFTNQEIAGQLVVSLNTVKKHTSNLFGKLGAANRTQAIAVARQIGLL
jgi:LuxR family maltose regulon positive regulatory protein